MGTNDLMTPKWEQEMLQINEDGWDMYFCVNQPKPDFVGVKPSDDEIQSYDRFIIDVDPLGTIAVAPSIGNIPYAGYWQSVVYSGRGLQLHCKFTPHDLSVVEIRSRVRTLFKEMKVEYFNKIGGRVDTSCTDASRLVRMPGTVNHKSKNVAWADPHPSQYYLHQQNMDPLRWEPEEQHEPPPPFNGNITNLSQVASRLTRTAVEYLTFGTIYDRHKTCFAAAISLREAGVSEEIALQWCWNGNTVVHQNYQLPKRDVEHCVKSAYQKHITESIHRDNV